MGASTPAREPDSWEIDEDMRTLARAEEIRRDPKRLARAKKRAAEKLDELKKVAAITAVKT
ncbi:MAG: hypothetical protein IV107_16370 [Paucibacter sp.]|nr:hypothetical protein [Roseateles sp.]